MYRKNWMYGDKIEKSKQIETLIMHLSLSHFGLKFLAVDVALLYCMHWCDGIIVVVVYMHKTVCINYLIKN